MLSLTPDLNTCSTAAAGSAATLLSPLEESFVAILCSFLSEERNLLHSK